MLQGAGQYMSIIQMDLVIQTGNPSLSHTIVGTELHK